MIMELKEQMKNAGIVGAGGAGFPSFAKLADGADTLLINGAECEPLVYTDYIILKTELENVIFGAECVARELGIRNVLLCVKNHTARRLSYTDNKSLSELVKVKILPDVYPMGDEISLIYEATGRLIQPGKLPITEGIIVLNVETLYNVAKAEKFNTPVIEKWLTVGGDIPNATEVKVPVGARISELLASLGISVPSTHAVIDGGPSMGKIIDPDTASVKKTTKGILILPKTVQAVTAMMADLSKAKARAETACCGCSRCTDLCPRALLGYPLDPHKMVRTAVGAAVVLPEMVLSATLCCGCGICESLACSQGISPKAVIANFKTLLAQNRMRFTSEKKFSATDERDYRKIPSSRWAMNIGVDIYDKLPAYIGERVNFKTLVIPTSQSIGAPSVPCVNVGDRVCRGDVIAEAAAGLSLPIHAPLDGKTVFADSKKIVIETDN